MFLSSPNYLFFFLNFLKNQHKLAVNLDKLENTFNNRLNNALNKEKTTKQLPNNLFNTDTQNLIVYNQNYLQTEYLNNYKSSLFKFLRTIINSTCIKELLQEIYPQLEKNDLELIDESFIDYAESLTIFEGLYNQKIFGNYNILLNKIIINKELRYQNFYYGKGICYVLHTGMFIVTLLHEMIEHLSRRFLFSYKCNDSVNNKTDRSTKLVIDKYQISNIKEYLPPKEGGRNLETLLLGAQREKLKIRQAFFLLNADSWKNHLHIFRNSFCNYYNDDMTIQDIKKTIDQNSCFFGLFNNSVIADEPELIPTQAIDYVKQIHGTVSQSIDLSEKSQGYLVNTLLSIN